MSRTGLHAALRRMVRLASVSLAPGAPPAQEILETERETRISRRRFIQTTGGTLLTVAAIGGCRSMLRARARRSDVRVVIVGAGLAGLTAAYELRKAGVQEAIYESASRIGGRVFTAHDIMAPGLTTELGGEFIDSKHRDLLVLIHEFDLNLIDTRAPEEAEFTDTYFFSRGDRTEVEILGALIPIVTMMREDFATLPESVDFQTRSSRAIALDRMSLDQYFERLVAAGFIRDLFAVAYTTEYGLDPTEQSALNLLTLFDPNEPTDPSTDNGQLRLYGESDERFKVRGGNHRVIEELVNRVGGQVRMEHRLESVRQTGGCYSLSFARRSGGSTDVHADAVLLTLPFSVLRDVELRLDLSKVKRKAIAELGYGRGAKLLMPFANRVWRKHQRSGNFFTDAGPQSGWDNNRGQPGDAGGLTIFTGGKKSIELALGAPDVCAFRSVPALTMIFPGADLSFSGRAQKFHWPSYSHSIGSYSCYGPGQWTSIAGAEALPIGNVFFSGEHCSREFQGFMNGAVETGRRADRDILHTIGVRGGKA